MPLGTNNDIKSFIDMIAPGAIRFYPDYYIFGNTYRAVWALRGYPPETQEQAILKHLGKKEGVTLHIYTRHVTPAEERKLIANTTNRNRLQLSNTGNLQDTVEAESNLKDVADLVTLLRQSREPLLHCAVFVEMIAYSKESLDKLQAEVQAELVRSKIMADRLLLKQKEGFLSVQLAGYNAFENQYEFVFPASSVANLYPMNYAGKCDSKGFYIGKDKNGSSMIVDFTAKSDDKSNSSILILGNSGMGKTYLTKLLLTNFRQAGLKEIVFDVEHEYKTLTENLGGCFVDLLAGKYFINVLEPLIAPDDDGSIKNILSKHISFLRAVFKDYKDLSAPQLDTMEILLNAFYQQYQLVEDEKLLHLKSANCPTLSDFYYFLEETAKTPLDGLCKNETLQELLLALHSICVGPDSAFFNGKTNIKASNTITFGVKGLFNLAGNVQNALLKIMLRYTEHLLIFQGNTVAALDELHIFLSDFYAMKKIRELLKRCRKRDSLIILGSQNLEDYTLPDIAEYTRPMFAIPTHQFLFNPGPVDSKKYVDLLQLQTSEYDIIKQSRRGNCLYRCGPERYHLKVVAPEYKVALWEST